MQDNYSFHKRAQEISPLSDKEVKEYLEKWCLKLKDNMFFETLHFEPTYKGYYTRHFLKQLLCIHLEIPYSDAVIIEYESLKCSKVKMDMFDILYEKGIVNRESDLIRKCPDIAVEDNVIVSDCLRRLFMCSGNENSYSLLYDEFEEMNDIFSEEQKQEFLLYIMKAFAIGGGSLCQYEDSFKPYFELTKKFYKAMVSVQRIHKSQDLYVTTDIFRVQAVRNGKSNLLFNNSEHDFNFCYVAIDKLNQKCTVWRNIFNPSLT